MLFDFFQGGGVVMLLDEGLDEIEDLLLSLGERHYAVRFLLIEFRFTFDNSILGGQSQVKDRRRELPLQKRLAHRSAVALAAEDIRPEIDDSIEEERSIQMIHFVLDRDRLKPLDPPLPPMA